jgi:hypothetical protein
MAPLILHHAELRSRKRYWLTGPREYPLVVRGDHPDLTHATRLTVICHPTQRTDSPRFLHVATDLDPTSLRRVTTSNDPAGHPWLPGPFDQKTVYVYTRVLGRHTGLSDELSDHLAVEFL